MMNFDYLICALERNNPESEFSDKFRAIMALNFLPRRYIDESGNLGEICTFAESKQEIALGDVKGKVYWEYFIPHTAVTAEFFSTVNSRLSIWNFTGELLRKGVEIYGLDECGNLFGISHKHKIRVISDCARKNLPSNAK
ncbi:hypothetical protein [Klebsiella grimontii]|uniref:hypothetical protein n=1 Tax=Klebsiella grimontii TaxID=2058152 RepID=UPI002247335F|nr:hypothetical protein [Klebsiella grimontii]MCW9528191.1 hypothetical protein [Klebsiella grimontii]MDU8000749.1 hypothetical protein [Klebsiella sp.]